MSNISSDSAWTILKITLLNNLYTTSINFWNLKLAKLIQRNAQFHGVILSEEICGRSAIQYNHRLLRGLPVSWLETPLELQYTFPLHDSAVDLKEELKTIAHELKKIQRERYESDRFLSALTMYHPTKYQLSEFLGDNLFSIIATSVRTLTGLGENILQTGSIEDFLSAHARILEHMQERVLVNLIMSDIVKDVV